MKNSKIVPLKWKIRMKNDHQLKKLNQAGAAYLEAASEFERNGEPNSVS